MKRKLLYSVATVFLLLSFSSCEKDVDEPIPAISGQEQSVDIKNGRIAFLNDDVFALSIEAAMTRENPQLMHESLNIEEAIIKSHFKPLIGSPSIKLSVDNGKLTSEDDNLIADEDSLIPDPYFASLFNQDRELQIGEKIIKITKEGTYICHASKYNRLLEILQDNPEHGNSSSPDDEAGDYKDLEEGIFFFDSFASEGSSKEINFSMASPEEEREGENPNSRVTHNYLPKAIYESFDTHSFGSHTIVGGWIESGIGRREVEYVYFTSKERLKLNFYNINYVVFSSVGMTAKAQHKTWIGWHGDLKADEIRMGWDGLSLEFPTAYRPSTGIPTVSFEKLKLGDIGIDIASYNFLSDNLNTALADKYVKDIANAIDGKIQDTFSSTLKKSYDVVYKNVAPIQYNYYKAYTDQFRLVYPNKVNIILGRHEEVEYNVHSISKNFDWSTGVISFSTNGTSFGISNLGLKNNAVKYKILKASVYAAAKRGGQWKGVRIVKE